MNVGLRAASNFRGSERGAGITAAPATGRLWSVRRLAIRQHPVDRYPAIPLEGWIVEHIIQRRASDRAASPICAAIAFLNDRETKRSAFTFVEGSERDTFLLSSRTRYDGLSAAEAGVRPFSR